MWQEGTPHKLHFSCLLVGPWTCGLTCLQDPASQAASQALSAMSGKQADTGQQVISFSVIIF